MYGEYLRSARLTAGLTLVELAKLAGVSQGYLSKVERGAKGPLGPRYARAIEEATGLPAGELVRRAVEERAVVGFSTEAAGPMGRVVLGLLWERYRAFSEADWERLGDALVSDDFPDPPERTVELDDE